MAHLPPGNVLDMHDPQVAGRAKGLGIRSVPAVVIDGKLADCGTGRGPDEATLRAGDWDSPSNPAGPQEQQSFDGLGLTPGPAASSDQSQGTHPAGVATPDNPARTGATAAIEGP
jgi:hypothetical protein